MTETEEWTWKLNVAEYKATLAKVQALNERAAKKGWTGRLVVEATRFSKKVRNEWGFEATEEGYRVKIVGEPPRYNGWIFLARLKWDQNAGLVVNTSPGVDKIDRSTLRENWCDHCETARYRTKIYVVRNAETGEQRQVGSTCVKDFLGWDKNPVLFWDDDLRTEIGGWLEGGGASGYEHDWPTELVLAASVAAIRAWGWHPASAGYTGSTKEAVLMILDPWSRADREAAEELRPYVADSYGEAERVREFVLSDAFGGDSEYVSNLKAILAADHVSASMVGYAASAPRAWLRHLENEIQRERDRKRIVNEWVGKVGDKITDLRVTVKYLHTFETRYGTTGVYTLYGVDDHRLYKWFTATASLGREIGDGTVWTIKGTVKDHEDYKGTKSTVLTRCKVLKEEKGGSNSKAA
jgi:hypothetical protein